MTSGSLLDDLELALELDIETNSARTTWFRDILGRFASIQSKRLSKHFSAWADSLSDTEREAFRRWQNLDRGYQDIQKAALSGDDSEHGRTARVLMGAIQRGRLLQDEDFWRGVRSSTKTFGVPSYRLTELVGQPFESNQFMAASVSKKIALKEFTRPPLDGGPVLIKVKAKRGTPAGWVSSVSDLGRDEILFPPGVDAKIVGVSYRGKMPVVEMEVSDAS